MDLDDDELKATRRMYGLDKTMSDEEKEAIDKLKRSANYFVMPIYETTLILNLIEKQNKIINKMANEFIEKTLMYSDWSKEDLIKYFEGRRDERDETDDKIKAKIEEIEKDENPSIADFQEYAQEYAKRKMKELLEDKE